MGVLRTGEVDESLMLFKLKEQSEQDNAVEHELDQILSFVFGVSCAWIGFWIQGCRIGSKGVKAFCQF